MNPDGTMMRGRALEWFAERHTFPLITIQDLVEAQIPVAP
jgi:3,4-dihydroxy-2-butanone 4-phosphate synthase